MANESALWGTDAWQGWVIVTSSDRTNEHWSVSYSSETGTWTAGGVMGNAVAIAERDDSSPAYRNTPEIAQQRRYEDGLAGQVASQVLGADIYVTERQYLHIARWSVADGVALCRVEDALPLVGLYLRAQGEFLIAHRYRLNEGLYYWVGMRELLPAAWRWFAACVQSEGGSGVGGLVSLGQSALERVARALKARDQVLVALNQPQHSDTRGRAVANLDEVLVNLMGAVDVTARMAHVALNLPTADIYGAGWQKQRWLKVVGTVDATLPLHVGQGSANERTLTILRKLRNSVHGAALQMVGFRDRRLREDETRLILPREDESEVLDAMDALGGSSGWGARRFGGQELLLEPGELLEALFPRVLDLLNEIMLSTPVERLPHVALTPEQSLPPVNRSGSTDVWDEWVRNGIRWQLGF